MHRRYISIEPGNFPGQVRGRQKIDLITLNVKLTLSGEEGGGSLVGLELTLRKNEEKPTKR